MYSPQMNIEGDHVREFSTWWTQTGSSDISQFGSTYV